MNDNTKKVLSGIGTGFLNTLLFHPLDTLRVRYFFGKGAPLKASSYVNGILFNSVATSIKITSTYASQEYFKEELLKSNFDSKQSQMISGFLTGGLIAIIGVPINTIKVPLQESKRNGSWSTISKNIYRDFGVKGFYRGSMPLITRDIVWSNVYFPLFGFAQYHIDRYLNKNKNAEPKNNKTNSYLTRKTDILASMIASPIAAAVAYPFDGMRMYMQHPNSASYGIFHGFLESLKNTAHNKRSFAIGILRAALSVNFSHISYLLLKDFMSETR